MTQNIIPVPPPILNAPVRVLQIPAHLLQCESGGEQPFNRINTQLAQLTCPPQSFGDVAGERRIQALARRRLLLGQKCGGTRLQMAFRLFPDGHERHMNRRFQGLRQRRLRGPAHDHEVMAQSQQGAKEWCPGNGSSLFMGAKRAPAGGSCRYAGLGLHLQDQSVWRKIRKDGGSDGRGVGFYFRNVTEFVLFGVRGSMPGPWIPVAGKSITSRAKSGNTRESLMSFIPLSSLLSRAVCGAVRVPATPGVERLGRGVRGRCSNSDEVRRICGNTPESRSAKAAGRLVCCPYSARSHRHQDPAVRSCRATD